jgi:hypothetical protein
MLHFDWEVKAAAGDLPALLERCKALRGRVMIFQRVMSFAFLSRRSNLAWLA